MVYTLSRAIKEERKNEEGVGNLESKREQGWQTEKKVKKRNERRGLERLVFLFFISAEGSNEREYCNRRGRFPFLVKLGESTEREG